jgi:hypothetical protein
MGVKLGLFLWGRNIIDWGFFRTECWGGYLDQKGRRTDNGENCIMMSFMTCILRRILLGWLNQGGLGGLDIWHAWGRGEVLTGFWLGGSKARDCFYPRPTHKLENHPFSALRDSYLSRLEAISSIRNSSLHGLHVFAELCLQYILNYIFRSIVLSLRF